MPEQRNESSAATGSLPAWWSVRMLRAEAERLLAENEELRGRLKLACEPCAECGHVDWRELDDILEKP